MGEVEIPEGAITEVFGDPSSGRTSLVLSQVARSTQAGEVCAWMDTHDSLDVASAVRAGVVLENLIWVRCGGDLRSAMKAADLLLHGGGLGLLTLDIAGASKRDLNRIPLSYWYRFRRAVEHTPTSLIVLTDVPLARNTAALALEMKKDEALWTGTSADFQILRALRFQMISRRGLRTGLPVKRGEAVA